MSGIGSFSGYSTTQAHDHRSGVAASNGEFGFDQRPGYRYVLRIDLGINA